MTTTVRAAGMSLRDWFAGQVLAGILANPNNRAGDSEREFDLAVTRCCRPGDSERHFDLEVTRCCYRIADAMMERRK